MAHARIASDRAEESVRHDECKRGRMVTNRSAASVLLVALTACNSVVFPSFGGSDEDRDGRTMPSPNPGPSYPYPAPTSQPTPCILPDKVTAEGTLVRESTDAGAPNIDAGDAGDDAAPPIEPNVTSYDVRIDFTARGGDGVSFGGRPSTCVGCQIRSESFGPVGGSITIRIPDSGGPSAFAAAAVKVPFGCGGDTGVVTLKVVHEPGDSRVSVDAYVTN